MVGNQIKTPVHNVLLAYVFVAPLHWFSLLSGIESTD